MPRCCLKAARAGKLIGAAFQLETCVKNGCTTMRLIMLGAGLALVGLQAVQAQVTIDITKVTCNQYLADKLTDSRTLGIWLNG